MSSSRKTHASLQTIVATAVIMLLPLSAAGAQAESRWQPAMDRFAELDRENPPKPGGILFLGSSSVRRWDLARWLPGHGATNRGFGGSQIADSVRHFDRLVVPHRPRSIFFYAGDNDIAAGKTAEQVASDFDSFTDLVKSHFPETKVWFIAIKPSLARWQMWPAMKEANRRIAEASKSDPLLEYVDVASPTLGADGEPLSQIFVEDGLHLNDAGYEMWADIIEPLLGAKQDS
jgi:lysophospholipase L1-like esterase